MIRTVLGIETSCDDTSVAIVRNDGYVEVLVSANQDLAHAPFGGIVPEIASRNHTLQLLPLIDQALTRFSKPATWDLIDGIAVTNRPGLMGSLIVGVSTAKTLAQVLKKPLIGVNHLEGHLLAGFLWDSDFQTSLKNHESFVALAVSGGHSTLYWVPRVGHYEVMGTTLDDAAGEAFDKFGKMVGLGFPGGVRVDRESRVGNPQAYLFPRSLLAEDTLMMSFSGLKSAAQRQVDSMSQDDLEKHRADLCASFQEAVVDVLIHRLDQAMKFKNSKIAVLTGGVSANSRLRERATVWAKKNNYHLVVPPIRYCTDNAAMIAFVGAFRLNQGESDGLGLGASPSSYAQDFIGTNR